MTICINALLDNSKLHPHATLCRLQHHAEPARGLYMTSDEATLTFIQTVSGVFSSSNTCLFEARLKQSFTLHKPDVSYVRA